MISRKQTLIVSVCLLSIAGLFVSCANSIEMPQKAHFGPSTDKATKNEFPYMISIEAVQHMRFNPHTYGFGNEKSKMTYYVFLKRDHGTLSTGEFFMGLGSDSSGSFYSMPLSRGTINISGTAVLLDVELGQPDYHGLPLQSSWQKSPANGEYQIVK